MKCRNCGEELPEGAVFCGNCGTRQDVNEEVSDTAEDTYETEDEYEYEDEESESEEDSGYEPEPEYEESREERPTPRRVSSDEPRKKLPIKSIIGIVAVLAVIIIIVRLVSGGSDKKVDIYATLDEDSEGIVVIYDNKSFTISADDDFVDVYIDDGDINDTSAIIVAKTEKEVYDAEKDGTYTEYYKYYYYVYGNEKYCLLTDDGYSCFLATEANAVAYITGDYELYLFNGKKSEAIADDISRVRISPDGKTLVYRTYEDDVEDTELVIYQSGKSEKIAEGMTPISVSNKGKYIYAYDTDNRLYALNAKGESEKIQSEINVSSCAVNSDSTEIMYSSDGTTYISVKGGEKQKLFSSAYVYSVNTTNETLDMDKFEGHYYVTYDAYTYDTTLYYLNKKLETTKIASSISVIRNYDTSEVAATASGIYTTKNEKKVIYVKNYGIYEYSKSSDESEKIIKDIYYDSFRYDCFAVSEDGDAIYYINDEDEFCYYDGIEATVLDDDGDSVEQVYVYGNAMFFLYDAYTKYNKETGYAEYTTYDMYYYREGDSKAKSHVSDVWTVTIGNNYMYYTTRDGSDCEAFVSSNGKKFSSILTYEK